MTVRSKQTLFIFFDLKDAAMIPKIAEPFFSVFRAEVDFSPVMNGEDLMKGLQSLGSGHKAA